MIDFLYQLFCIVFVDRKDCSFDWMLLNQKPQTQKTCKVNKSDASLEKSFRCAPASTQAETFSLESPLKETSCSRKRSRKRLPFHPKFDFAFLPVWRLGVHNLEKHRIRHTSIHAHTYVCVHRTYSFRSFLSSVETGNDQVCTYLESIARDH